MHFDPAASELLEQHRKAKREEREAERRVREFLRDNPQGNDDARLPALLEQAVAASRRAQQIWEQLRPLQTED